MGYVVELLCWLHLAAIPAAAAVGYLVDRPDKAPRPLPPVGLDRWHGDNHQ